MKTFCLSLLILFVTCASVFAEDYTIIGLTNHKSILWSQASNKEAKEIKLASPVAADQLLGITLADILPDEAGVELIVLRADQHIEIYPLPDGKSTILKRLGYCPIINPAKREAIAITAVDGKLYVLSKINDDGNQYAEMYSTEGVALTKPIQRKSYLNLKNPKSPHKPLTRIDGASGNAWLFAEGISMVTCAEDQYVELYKVLDTSAPRIGQGIKRSGDEKLVSARWFNQQAHLLYQDGSIAVLDQKVPVPTIVNVLQSPVKDCIDFVMY